MISDGSRDTEDFILTLPSQ